MITMNEMLSNKENIQSKLDRLDVAKVQNALSKGGYDISCGDADALHMSEECKWDQFARAP